MRVVDPNYRARCLVEGTPLRGSCGMAFDCDGNVLVGHVFSARVSRIDLSSGEVSTFIDPSRGLIAADDITSDGQGNCWSSCTSGLAGESIYRIGRHGEVRKLYGGIAGANGIQFNRRTGRLFVGQFGAGNGLYEIDPEGRTAPRLITKAFASTNALDFDPEDNLLVTVAGGRIARVHPDTGAWSLLDVSFPHNSALKVGAAGEIYVTGYEAGFGIVWRVAPDGKSMEVLSSGVLPPLDNLLYSPTGRLFVSSLRDATVIELDLGAQCRELRRFSRLGPPTIGPIASCGNRLFVNDGLSLRELDRTAGRLAMTLGSFYERRGFPIPGCMQATDDGRLYMCQGPQSSMSNVADGRIFHVDSRDFSFSPVNSGAYQAVNSPSALCVAGNDILVAEFLSGQVVSIDQAGDDTRRAVVGRGLQGPLGLVHYEGRLYVAESLGQRISIIDLESGRQDVLASAGAVGRPTALALDAQGFLIAVDANGHRLLRIDRSTGSIALIAENLAVYPIIVSNWPLLAVANGLAVGASGELYVGGNIDGSLWCLERAAAS